MEMSVSTVVASVVAQKLQAFLLGPRRRIILTLAIAGFAIAGAVFVFWSWRLRRSDPWVSSLLLEAGVGFVFIGMVDLAVLGAIRYLLAHADDLQHAEAPSKDVG
jgi:hypothetical protein